MNPKTADNLPVIIIGFDPKADESFDALYINKRIPDYDEFSLKLKEYLNEGLIKFADLEVSL